MTESPKLTPSTVRSEDQRTELLWDTREEKYIKDIEQKCKDHSMELQKKGYRQRMCYRLWGIPSMILPLIAAAVSEYAIEHKAYGTILMLLSAVCTSLNTFFNFGKRYQQLFDGSQKYQELADEIGLELCKPRKYRLDCDLVLQRVNIRRNNIAAQIPP